MTDPSEPAATSPGPACPRCGVGRHPDDRYCTSCGRPLARPASRRPALLVGGLAIALLVAIGAALVVTLGPQDGVAASSPGTSAEPSPTASPTASPRASAPSQAAPGTPFGTALASRSTGCANGALACTVLTVPADHAAPGSETIEVRFGLHESEDGAPAGTLVIATGGPGTSGIQLVDLYLGMLPDVVLDRYDVVLYEQRGVGRSEGLSCRRADANEPAWAELGRRPAADAAARASAWVTSCLDEAGIAEASALDRFATRQAAADLDAYLDHIGAGEVVFLAESYGTDLAQVYAAMRPERVAGMVLDGVIDPVLPAPQARIDQARGFGAVLDQVLDACAQDPACAADFAGDDPGATWDALAARLSDGPIDVPLGEVTAELTLDGLSALTASLLYVEPDRSALLRLLAAAARDDLGPLTRAASLGAGRDPETGGVLATVDGSVASHLGIACQGYEPGDAAVGVADLQSAARQDVGRLAAIVYADIPCLAGFAGAASDGHEAIDGIGLEDFDGPVLLLTSEADPATPIHWAETVADRLPNGYLIVSAGGPHGTFGRGIPCPDDIVKEFLAFDELPEDRVTDCPGTLTAPYTPLPLGGPEAYPNVLEALVAVEEQVLHLPDYLFWDGLPRSAACPFGGRLSLAWQGDEKVTLDGCALLPDWPMEGSMTLSPDGTTRMVVDVANGRLEYESRFDWTATVEGVLDGEALSLSR